MDVLCFAPPGFARTELAFTPNSRYSVHVNSSQLVITANGRPEDVLELKDRELAAPGPGEARIRILAAPINPADLNICEGTYGLRPPLPAVGGVEGVAVIDELGEQNGPSLTVGTRVLCVSHFGWWASHAVVKTKRLTALNAPDLSDEQAAMLSVNPYTAWGLIHDMVELPKGAWLVQNAANSGVGRCVIQLAKQLGLHTINLVRRESLVDELTALGADAVFTGESLDREKVKALTGGAPVLLGLNATSGPMLRALTKCLTESGTVVTYGAMAREPFTLGNGSLIFKDLRARGYWLTRQRKALGHEALGERLQALARANLEVSVEASYGLADWRSAIEHAQRDSRSGKILFTGSAETP